MAFTNADNNFGPSSFVVGPVIGVGCNYTSVQSAVTDALASGTTSVYIRPGAYIGDVTIPNNISLIGASGAEFGSSAVIQGQIICTNGTINLSNLNIAPTNPAEIPIIIASVGYVILGCDACNITSNTSGAVAVHFQSGPSQSKFINCDIRSSTTAIFLDDVGEFLNVQSCVLTGGGVAAGFITNNPGYQFTIESTICETGGASHVSNNTGGFITRFCRYNSFGGVTAFQLTTGVSILNMAECEVQNNAGSGEWVNGVGIMAYADVVLSSTAINIGAGLTVTTYDWKPYAQTAAAAPGSVRGTASFDSVQFTVTDGWVQNSGIIPSSFPADTGTATPVAGVLNILGGQGVTTSGAGNTITINSVEWSITAAGFSAVEDHGYYIANAALTVVGTLPAAPGIGSVIKFIRVNTGDFTVQAPAATTIQMGNQTSSAAGTLSSTDIGDALELVSFSNTAWFVQNSQGNWTIL